MAICKCCGQSVGQSTFDASAQSVEAAWSTPSAPVTPAPAPTPVSAHAASVVRHTDSDPQTHLDAHLAELLEQSGASSAAEIDRLSVASVILAMTRMISVAPFLKDAGIDAVALRRALRHHAANADASGPDDTLGPLLLRAHDIAAQRGMRRIDIPVLIESLLTAQSDAPALILFLQAATGTLPAPSQARTTAPPPSLPVDAPKRPATVATHDTEPLARLSSDRGRGAAAPMSAPIATESRRHWVSGAARGTYRSRARLRGMRTLRDPRQLSFHGLQPEWSRASATAPRAPTDAVSNQSAPPCAAIGDRMTRLEADLAELATRLEQSIGTRITEADTGLSERLSDLERAVARLGQDLTARFERAEHAALSAQDRAFTRASPDPDVLRGIQHRLDALDGLLRQFERDPVDRERRTASSTTSSTASTSAGGTSQSRSSSTRGPHERWGDRNRGTSRSRGPRRRWRFGRGYRRRLSERRSWPWRSLRKRRHYRYDHYRHGRLILRSPWRRGTWRHERTREPIDQPREKRFYLAMGDDIVDAPSIGPRTADRLRPVGIYTVRDLMGADPEALAEAVAARHITPDVIRAWQTQSRLVMTIPWLRGTHAQLLVGAGYHKAADIAAQPSNDVLAAILRFASTREGQRVLRDGPPPPEEKIVAWTANAREAEPHRAA